MLLGQRSRTPAEHHRPGNCVDQVMSTAPTSRRPHVDELLRRHPSRSRLLTSPPRRHSSGPAEVDQCCLQTASLHPLIYQNPLIRLPLHTQLLHLLLLPALLHRSLSLSSQPFPPLTLPACLYLLNLPTSLPSFAHPGCILPLPLPPPLLPLPLLPHCRAATTPLPCQLSSPSPSPRSPARRPPPPPRPTRSPLPTRPKPYTHLPRSVKPPS
ncbi:unnamed protein product [Closterium sp. NIES-53]